ncbi:MAG: hypothetical protein V2A79_19140 [Planctomycetota bacterium]
MNTEYRGQSPIFRPTDGQEARYWLGGRNVMEGSACDDTPYHCWRWSDEGESVDSAWVWWVPEVGAPCSGPLPPWCYGQCVRGGWLSGQPDDGGPDCVENGEEQRMQFVFNLGGNPAEHGLADAPGGEAALGSALVRAQPDTTPPRTSNRLRFPNATGVGQIHRPLSKLEWPSGSLTVYAPRGVEW